MTSSAGTSGLIFAGSPPRSAIASRMAARSTTAGTPVKSCMTTRAGVKAISLLGLGLARPSVASASMSWRVDGAVALGAQQVLEQDLQARTAAARRRTSTAARPGGRSRARGRRPSRVPRASKEFGCVGHGSWSFQRSAGSSTKACPSGVVSDGTARRRWRCGRVRSRPASATSEASVRPTPGGGGDGQRLVHRVGPPAHGVGAAARGRVPRVLGSPPTCSASDAVDLGAARAARSRGPRRASRRARPPPRGRGSAPAQRSATIEVGVDDDASSPRACTSSKPTASGARRFGPLHGAGERAADELRLRDALVGRPPGERLVELRLEVDARLLHPT